MRTIYKYPLQITDYQTILIPEFALFTHIAMQYDKPTLWLEVDTSKPVESINILCFGTGMEIPESMELFHLGTVIDGDFVWHFYSEGESL